MNNTTISKTLLTIQPGLDDYAKMLGERAHSHALCSCNTPFLTNRIIDKIIDLNVKQHTIHNLITHLNAVISQLPITTQKVLHSYYRPHGVAPNIQHQAQVLGISERTFYRHLDRANDYITHHLNNIGINFFTWQNLLHNYTWIKETFMHQCQLSQLQTTAHQTEPNHSTVHPHQHTKPANQIVA